VSTANISSGVAAISFNEVNHIAATGIEAIIPEELGRSKCKRIPRQLADTLNGCLCGLVLNSSLNGILKCRQASCETQWVSTLHCGH